MRAGPSQQLLARQVEVGWSVWERIVDDSDVDPRGGIVVNIDARVDHETGEIVRWFRIIHFPQGRPAFFDLSEHTINPDAINLPNGATVRSAVRRLNELLGRHRGSLTSDTLEWQDIALRLARSIG